ncbi:MAG: tail fiber domain-containing protein, partial [Verrucomicrobiota bacterium]
GTNYTGTGLFKFALVNAAGNTTYWSNDATSNAGSEPTAAVSLTVTRSVFSVNLGDTTVAHMTQTIPASVFANSAVYLRVWFNGGSGSQLLSPDRRITSVAYALKAASATETDPVFGASAAGGIVPGDLATWNAKVDPTRTLSTTAPLAGGGDLSANRTLSIAQASGSADGYLSSANWTTFNSKIGGSGTAIYVPKFTASGTVGDSSIVSDASGRVGIGTSTPNGKLEVIDNGAISGGNTARFYNPSLADAGVHYISIGKSSVNNECALMGFTKQAAISKAWLGVTGDDIIGGIGLTVQKGGNVGIGDNSPAYRFSVFNNISGDYAARIYNAANSSSANGLLIRAGCNSGTFSAVMIGFQNIDAAAIGSISQNAAFTVSYNTSSDRRLKENITPTHFGLADLMKLQAVDYNFIADASKTPQTGFIAQDLDAVFPDAVTEGGDDAKTKPWSVDYGRVTPLLVKSIQDLKAENDALKAANDVLQAQNADILQRLAAIEAKLGK